MQEIVKYHNELNEVRLSGFVQTDLDMFMMLCARMRDQGTDELSFTFAELKETLSPSNRTDAEFLRDLDRMRRKLGGVTVSFRSGDVKTTFSLFPTLRQDEGRRILTVSVNKDFAYLLNEVRKNFTVFELQEFIRLEGRYSKNLYKLLKQYRSTGEYKVEAGELRRLLDCPEGYPNKEFMRTCLNPAIRELSACFPGLAVEAIRGAERGRPVKEYRFTFQAEQKKPAASPADPKRHARRKNSFNNFTQREYDWQEYERLILNEGGQSENSVQ